MCSIDIKNYRNHKFIHFNLFIKPNSQFKNMGINSIMGIY